MYKFILAALAFILVSATFSGEITKQFEVSPGGKLDVDIKTGGSIIVNGWDKNLVEVIVSHNGDKLDDDIWLDIDGSDNSVSVSMGADGNVSQNIQIEVNIPRVFNINVITMGGDLILNDIQGQLEGETMGGDLKFQSLKGKVKFTTMGGDIDLQDSDVDGKVSTMGGKVMLENVVGDVDGSSMGGNVIYKNVKSRNGKSAGKEVKISTMGGEIEVEEAMHGANVSTMGGDIEIRKAKDYVKANTMGGDISIDDIDGWVKATTMGGDIDVYMTGDPKEGKRDVEISSMGGDIDLTLPDGISAEFDIKINYTRNSRQNYKIESDFPIKINETKDWKYSGGDPRKVIEGEGKTGAGEHHIKITTTNGNVKIRKK